MRRFKIAHTALLAAVAANSFAFGANKTWTAGNGSWSVGANWTPANSPANGDSIFLTSSDGSSRTVTYDNANAALTFGNVLLNSTAGGTFAINQTGLTHNGNTLILGTTGRGIYNISGGTLNFTTLNSSTAAASAATFNQSAGATSIGTINLGVFSNATLLLSGGSIDSTTVNLSQSGNATITQTGGQFNVTGTVNISDAVAGGTGTYNLQGGTLTAGQVVINAGGAMNLASGINTPTLTINTGGTLTQTPAPTFISHTVLNGGTIDGDYDVGFADSLDYNAGTLSGRLNTFGKLVLNADMTIDNGWRNFHINTNNIPASRTLTLNGQGLSQNDGTLTLNGTLNTTDSFIGGQGVVSTPIFNHANGVHNVSNELRIGQGFAPGTYNLAAGTLNVASTAIGAKVGVNQPGILNVINGRANITTLTIGAGAPGTVNMTGTGRVSSNTIVIGDTAPGKWFQNSSTSTLTATSMFIAKNAGAAASEYQLTAGTFSPNKVNNDGTITLSGGRAILNQAISGTGLTNVVASGSLTFGAIIGGRMFIGGNGRVFSQPSGNAVGMCQLSELTFEEPSLDAIFGQWDLNNNHLAIDYTTTSPIDTIRRYIRHGFSGGNWNGTGLISSAAAASPASAKTALGYAESTDVFTVFPSNFFGVAADPTMVLVRHTLIGDANLSGSVNLNDFTALAANFGLASTWSRGDFNYDGFTNLSDFTALASNFGVTFSGEQPRSTPAPEPVLPAVALTVGLVAHRRRRT